jgi:hypothetical protein
MSDRLVDASHILMKRAQGATTRNAGWLDLDGVEPTSGMGRRTLEIPPLPSCRHSSTLPEPEGVSDSDE